MARGDLVHQRLCLGSARASDPSARLAGLPCLAAPSGTTDPDAERFESQHLLVRLKLLGSSRFVMSIIRIFDTVDVIIVDVI